MVPQPRIARIKSQACNVAEHQHGLIETLSASIADLQARVARLEAQIPPHRFDTQATPDFEHPTRDALRHLNDVAKLADSELAHALIGLGWKPISGRILQSMLTSAIHALRPTAVSASLSPTPNYYEILHLTYQEGISANEAARCLAISKRQYYRELRAAILAVADQLINAASC